MIKVITGIRRCGKSTLMELFQAELRLDGVPDSQIIAVNLEDFANIELRDPMKLHAYILSRAGNERAYVFLDEIQNVRDFPPMIDSLFLRKKRQLPVTYIIFLLYGVVFVGVDLWLANALMNLPIDYDDTRSLIRAIVACCIWIPYFRVSERVKRTFVH